jgi:hypothetical protein
MRREFYPSVVMLVLAAAGCGPSQEERAKEVIAERRDAVLTQLRTISELGSSKQAIAKGGDTVRGVAPDFREATGGGKNPSWDAMVLRDEQLAKLDHYLRNQTASYQKPPLPEVDMERYGHRVFGSGGMATDKPELPISLHDGRGADFSRYAWYLFNSQQHDSPEDVRRNLDELSKVRYLLAVRLTSAVAPLTTGASKERPGQIGVDYGSLAAEARLYDVPEKRYLGGFEVLATNTPNLRVEYEKFGSGDTAVSETLKLLKKDLDENFIKTFWQEVQIRFPDARVPRRGSGS